MNNILIDNKKFTLIVEASMIVQYVTIQNYGNRQAKITKSAEENSNGFYLYPAGQTITLMLAPGENLFAKYLSECPHPLMVNVCLIETQKNELL